MSSYFTGTGPQVVAGLIMQSETRVQIGTARLWGSMEVSSAAYLTYTASIGLQSGKGIDLGELESIGFSHAPTFENPDTANVVRSSLELLTEEETTISLGIRQFDPQVLELMVGTGVMYTLGNARLITGGGKCTTEKRPIEIYASNIGCNAPAAEQSVLTGITAIVITAYDCSCTSGIPWDDILANEINVLDTEWTVHPVNSLDAGNRRFSVFIY